MSLEYLREFEVLAPHGDDDGKLGPPGLVRKPVGPISGFRAREIWQISGFMAWEMSTNFGV